MKLSIGFRRAIPTDVDFLLQLRKSTMTLHLNKVGIYYSDKDHVARINEFFSDSFIITNHKESIGLIKLGVLADRVHIRQFQILPSFHGKGVGSFVLKVTKKKAQELNLPVTLNVLKDNPAKSLYIRHSFYVEEEQKLEYKMRCDNV